LIGQIEREYFIRLLDHYQGNVARTARHCGLSRRSVAQKLRKYDLDRLDFKRSARVAKPAAVTVQRRRLPFTAPEPDADHA
jgi:hypothetical protein